MYAMPLAYISLIVKIGRFRVPHMTVKHISFTVPFNTQWKFMEFSSFEILFCLSWVLYCLVKDLLLKYSNFPLHSEALLLNIFHGWRIFKESKLVIKLFAWTRSWRRIFLRYGRENTVSIKTLPSWTLENYWRIRLSPIVKGSWIIELRATYSGVLTIRFYDFWLCLKQPH